MKKFMMTLMAAVLLCGTMNAQDNKHEIAVTYGAGTTTDFVDGWGKVGALMFTGGHTTFENEKHFGPISAEYFYRISPVVGVGVIGAYEKTTEDVFESRSKVGDVTRSDITVMPAVKFNWLRKKNWGMYSKVGIGVTFETRKETNNNTNTSESDNSIMFNFQATALGVEFGQSICGFAELGFGEQGAVLAGIRYKF